MWLRFCRSDPPPPPPPSWVTGLSHWSPSDKESQTSCVFFLHVVIFSLPGQLKQLRQAAAAFFKAKEEMFCRREEPLQQKKKKKNQGAIPPPSLVTVWGIQSKVCPVTCSPRNKQPAESPKTKAIRGGRLVLRAKSRPPFFFSFLFFFWELPSWKKLLVVAVESD